VTNDQRGTATVELVLLTPLLVAFLLFVVAVGRLAESRADVNAAARDGARAASIAPNGGAAPGAAQDAAQATLASAGVSCGSFSVTTDTGSFDPGTQVKVTVSCDVQLGDLSPLVGGSRTVTSEFVEVIDRFRGFGG
jgi:Flp pilus assembly protein TadG